MVVRLQCHGGSGFLNDRLAIVNNGSGVPVKIQYHSFLHISLGSQKTTLDFSAPSAPSYMDVRIYHSFERRWRKVGDDQVGSFEV